MKKTTMKKFVLSAFCLLWGMAMAWAADIPESSLTWELVEGKLVIEGSGAMPDFASPDSIPWYEARKSITSIEIGSGVTTISEGAFYQCSSLTNVTIPASVTTIGIGVFYQCSSLTSVTIPGKVTAIGREAFYECSLLTNVTIGESVTTIGGKAFYGCSGLTSVTIPGSVENIGDGAFYQCSSLTSVTIPGKVTAIGIAVFYECSSLTNVTIPASVTTIGDGAFQLCSSLASVTMKPTTPPTLGYEVLPQGINTIYVPAGSKSAYEAVLPGPPRFMGRIIEAWMVNIAPTAYGSVSVGVREGYEAGETVTVTATPDDGYYLASLVYNDGEDHYITKDKSFTMPEGNVTIKAKFNRIMTREEAESASWEAYATAISTTLKIGGTVFDPDSYAAACKAYGITPKIAPTVESVKVVPADAQVVGEGEVAVKETEIRAAAAETVKVEGGIVTLGVNVCSNGNFTAEKRDWKPVELKRENVSVENGRIVVTLPVGGDSGFMILQSGDAKIDPAK